MHWSWFIDQLTRAASAVCFSDLTYEGSSRDFVHIFFKELGSTMQDALFLRHFPPTCHVAQTYFYIVGLSCDVSVNNLINLG